MSTLPIHEVLAALSDALKQSRNVLLAAPPGSGKTTIVPIELVQQPWLAGKKILMLEPRRLATRAAAARMASLLGERVGETVGYQVRFDRKVSAQTRVEVITEGILTRRLQTDPELADVGLIIFDEFHERTLHADLALALSLDVANSLRDDLRILVMSATLDTEALSNLLNQPPLIHAEGQSYPVTLNYLEKMTDAPIPQVLVSGVLLAIKETQGDILAFLPGVAEIKRAEKLLKTSLPQGIDIHALYGDLTQQAQDLALKPSQSGARRVVLATSIAETSLTIEGIDVVVDSGWSRLPRFDPNSGLSGLQTIRVSKASADQRAGRAGRLGPGVCYRLWSSELQQRLVPHHSPEIANADLAPLVLELAQWGIQNPQQLDWVELPPSGLYEQAKSLLIQLEAITEEGRMTPLGREMVKLAAHPRLAHMILSAQEGQSQWMALQLAALLTEKDLLRPTAGIPKPVDIELRLHVLEKWRNSGRHAPSDPGIDNSVCHRIGKTVTQLRKKLDGPAKQHTHKEASAGALLSLAYPDRIAQRRSGVKGEGRYLLSSGKGVVLPAGDSLGGEPYLVIPALDAGRRDGRVYSAVSIGLESIRKTQSKRLAQQVRVEWDDNTGAVIARTEECLGALVLSHRKLDNIEPSVKATALFEGIRKRGIGALPFSKSNQQWLVRLQLLSSWQKEADWPDTSEQALLDSMESWLAPWVEGVSRLSQLKSLDWTAILKSRLSWAQQQAMEQLAPTHIRVPSGSNKQLDYSLGATPVLPVKLQELFGLMDTPTVCNGQVKVILHLLSPAQRPIQVTQDLRGFWEKTYAEVKKELKGRYPKHYWPEDPLAAIPTSRVRPKS